MAHDEELHDDEFEANEAEDSSDDSDDSDQGKVKADASDDDDMSVGSAAERARMRESMEAEVAAFLARGGQIQQIDDNVMADPPRKPQTNYGSRPI